jgi:hypothetical protein
MFIWFPNSAPPVLVAVSNSRSGGALVVYFFLSAASGLAHGLHVPVFFCFFVHGLHLALLIGLHPSCVCLFSNRSHGEQFSHSFLVSSVH